MEWQPGCFMLADIWSHTACCMHKHERQPKCCRCPCIWRGCQLTRVVALLCCQRTPAHSKLVCTVLLARVKGLAEVNCCICWFEVLYNSKCAAVWKPIPGDLEHSAPTAAVAVVSLLLPML